MNKIETKILNCFAVKEAEKNMVFAARLTQRGHIIHSLQILGIFLTSKDILHASLQRFQDAVHILSRNRKWDSR